MAVTITIVDRNTSGKWHMIQADVAMDSSYTTGGYTITASQVGLGTIRRVYVGSVNGSASGIAQPYWDYTAGKLMALRDTGTMPPYVIVDESVTISSNAGRLSQVPAYIMAVNASAGGTTGACSVVPTGSTLATTQCDVNFTNGNVKFFGTDAVTTALITYIPMGVGPFVPANQVIDETQTLANGSTTNLTNQAALVQYVYDSTTLLAPLAIIGTQNSPAAGQVQIQLLNSTNTTITDNAAQNAKVAKITYWKKSAFPTGTYGMVDRTSTNATSNVINYSSAMAAGTLNGTLINAFGVHHAALATNTDVPSLALGPAGTAATNSPVINPMTNRITYVGTDNITREFIAYILLNANLMNYSTECSAGTNLSGSTVSMLFCGNR